MISTDTDYIRLQQGFAFEMSLVAKQTVTAKLFENGDLCLFGTEIACLRIAYKYKNIDSKTKYHKQLDTWIVVFFNFSK